MVPFNGSQQNHSLSATFNDFQWVQGSVVVDTYIEKSTIAMGVPRALKTEPDGKPGGTPGDVTAHVPQRIRVL